MWSGLERKDPWLEAQLAVPVALVMPLSISIPWDLFPLSVLHHCQTFSALPKIMSFRSPGSGL